VLGLMRDESWHSMYNTCRKGPMRVNETFQSLFRWIFKRLLLRTRHVSLYTKSSKDLYSNRIENRNKFLFPVLPSLQCNSDTVQPTIIHHQSLQLIHHIQRKI
jgi:hypothetical protein